MKKITLSVVAGAVALIATPALASITLLGPYKSKGECNSTLTSFQNGFRKGDNSNYWLANNYTLSCQAINGQYYIVAD